MNNLIIRPTAIVRMCYGCKTVKYLVLFEKRRGKPAGHSYLCCACRKVHDAERHIRRKRRPRSPNEAYRKYRKNASLRNVPFDISFSDFMYFWRRPCGYCGADIATVGIDRLVNASGYVAGNLMACCRDCNFLKSSRDHNTFASHCIRIAMYLTKGTH